MAQPFNYSSFEDERLSQLNSEQELEQGPSTASLPLFDNQPRYPENQTDFGTLCSYDASQDGLQVQEPQEDSWEQVPAKPMAEFASQRFKRRPKASDARKPAKKAKAVTSTVISENVAQNEDEEDEEEELDEAELAETEEFYSQLIDLNAIGAAAEPAKERLVQRQRPRWHPSELEFFKRCVELYDVNYGMIQEFLPHRSIPEIKKQHDKQRALYPLLFASYALEPRFTTVEEYREKKRALENDMKKLEEEMKELGVKLWIDGNAKRILPTEEEENEAFYFLNDPELVNPPLKQNPVEEAQTSNEVPIEEEPDDSIDQYLYRLPDGNTVEDYD